MGVAFLGLSLSLASCATTSKSTDPMTTGSIQSGMSKPFEQMNASELAQAERSIGDSYAKAPKNRDIGLSYGAILRMTGKTQQSLAVMQQVAINNPTDRDVLAAYGKSQAAAGQLEQALSTISRAQTPDHPDWRLKSAEGAILDQLGRTDEARSRYRDALDIRPNEPSVLSNLGMSYLLTGDLKSAETYLRKAVAQSGAESRVRQNLALVVGLQGRFDEAMQIARAELTTEQADANVAYLRQMLSQQGSWKQLAARDTTKKKG